VKIVGANHSCPDDTSISARLRHDSAYHFPKQPHHTYSPPLGHQCISIISALVAELEEELKERKNRCSTLPARGKLKLRSLSRKACASCQSPLGAHSKHLCSKKPHHILHLSLSFSIFKKMRLCQLVSVLIHIPCP
jgi:hypothetical protein